MIPVLKGEGVILRGMTWADFPAFADMWAAPELERFLPFAPIERRECWARMNRIAWHWAHYGFGNFAIAGRQDGLFLGQVGIFHAARGAGDDADTVPEVGWGLTGTAQGRGLAGEAAELLHRWFDAQPFGGRTLCKMDPAHSGSVRLAQKCGYQVLRQDKDQWGALQVMERRAPARDKAKAD